MYDKQMYEESIGDSVKISLCDFKKLVDKATRLDVLAQSIMDKIDAGKCYPVDDELVRIVTKTLNYTKPVEDSDE